MRKMQVTHSTPDQEQAELSEATIAFHVDFALNSIALDIEPIRSTISLINHLIGMWDNAEGHQVCYLSYGSFSEPNSLTHITAAGQDRATRSENILFVIHLILRSCQSHANHLNCLIHPMRMNHPVRMIPHIYLRTVTLPVQKSWGVTESDQAHSVMLYAICAPVSVPIERAALNFNTCL
jgi:hypothetical protein